MGVEMWGERKDEELGVIERKNGKERLRVKYRKEKRTGRKKKKKIWEERKRAIGNYREEREEYRYWE